MLRNLDSQIIHSADEPLIAEIQLGVGAYVLGTAIDVTDPSVPTFDKIDDPSATTSSVTTAYCIRIGQREIMDTETIGAPTNEVKAKIKEEYPDDKTKLFMTASHKLRIGRVAQVSAAERMLVSNVEKAKNMRGRLGSIFGTVLGVSAMGVVKGAVDHDMPLPLFVLSTSAFVLAGFAVRAASTEDPTTRERQLLASDIQKLQTAAEDAAMLEVIQETLVSVRPNHPTAHNTTPTQE